MPPEATKPLRTPSTLVLPSPRLPPPPINQSEMWLFNLVPLKRFHDVNQLQRMPKVWTNRGCHAFTALIILVFACEQTFSMPLAGSSSEAGLRLQRRRPAFLYDAWGKRSHSPDLGPPSTWRVVEETAEHLLIAIPKIPINQDVWEVDEKLPALKRGAYLDLPWG
ncbi:unnamed protein product [Mesocestoides corti]|uniref:Uncharacterized protein n=2 Tax=Mesocestoides corti TaxID=53468 RepID=A0A0R3U8V3_MESCO|nr:unnamed protein product [Mesocestoides corti]